MNRSSRIPHGQQGPIPVNNSSLRRDSHNRNPGSVLHAVLAVALVAAFSGCHYCPNNRHVHRPSCGYACDTVGWPCLYRPWGRRPPACIESGCTDEGCLSGAERDSARSQAYYPEPVPIEAPPAPETEVAVDAPALEPSLLVPPATVDDSSAPPSDAPSIVEIPETAPSQVETVAPAPLFSGRVDLGGIDTAPQTTPDLPDAPAATPEPVPTTEIPLAPTPTQLDDPLDASPSPPETENVTKSSPFPLRFLPRLFRVREETAAETPRPAPPITEASWMQGSRLGGP